MSDQAEGHQAKGHQAEGDQNPIPDNWIVQAGKRMAARIKWMSEAYSQHPNQQIMASAESELLAAGGDMCDLQLLRQRAQREFQSE